MVKQRTAAYHPELALSRILFEGSAGPLTSLEWVRKRQGEPEPETTITRHPFSIPLINIGLGAAKNVVVSWSFPIEEIADDLNARAEATKTPFRLSYSKGLLSLDSHELGKLTSMWRNQKTETLDYVLPAAAQPEPAMIPLPHAYITAITALVFLAAKAEKLFPDLPPLRVTFEYSDIADRTQMATFDIHVDLEAFTKDATFMRGLLRPKRIN